MTKEKSAKPAKSKKPTLKAQVYKQDGKKAGEIELNELLFGAHVNQRLLDLVVTAYAGNQRRGTASTKGRAEVRGGGKKPWKQKGTGRARHSSRRSPIWRGGGITFGPKPRDYDTNLPDTMKQTAIISALSCKLKTENLTVVGGVSLKETKTKEVVNMINALGLQESRTLLIMNTVDEKLRRAMRNVKELVTVQLASNVNAYHIMRRKKLLIDQQAIETLEKRVLSLEPAGA